MTPTSNATAPLQPATLAKRMALGAAIGLLLISLFLLSAGEGNPGWGNLWMIRPLIVVPLAGAMGGLCHHFLVHFHSVIGLNKVFAIIISVVVYLIGLWVGTVLGLAGTMWN
ncbi:MAG TPA: hypothetical protein VGE66_03490 [Chitinophagaceae bacterium]